MAKKRILLVAAACMLLCIFSGCADKTQNNTTNGSQNDGGNIEISTNPNGGVEEGTYYPDRFDENVPEPDLSKFTKNFFLNGFFLFVPESFVEDQVTPTSAFLSGDGFSIRIMALKKSGELTSAEQTCIDTADRISPSVEGVGGEILLASGSGLHRKDIPYYTQYFFRNPMGSVVSYYETLEYIIEVTVTFESIETDYKMALALALAGNC